MRESIDGASIPRWDSWRLLDSLAQTLSSLKAPLLLDVAVVAVSFWLAYLIRFDGAVPELQVLQCFYMLPLVSLVYFWSKRFWGLHRQVWHFFGAQGATKIIAAVLCAGNFIFVANVVYAAVYDSHRVPIGVTLIHPLLVTAGWAGTRFLRRSIYIRRQTAKTWAEAEAAKRLLLVGAGQAGVSLVQELRPNLNFQIVGFIDDNPALRGRMIEGLPVLGKTDDLTAAVRKYQVDQVTLCMPSAPAAVRNRVAEACSAIGVNVTTVPTLSEILLGKLEISRLRPVKMEDLLCRTCLDHSSEGADLLRLYGGKRVLITGAGGSIGSELVRQVRDLGPSQLILLDKDENSVFEIGLEVREQMDRVTEVVADIRDLRTLTRIFEQWRPEVVFHAAAYKHVPLMEHHPAEAILNNVIGSRNVIDISSQLGVSNFVLISTDKAVNPTSIMGATKRIAELIVQSRSAEGGATKFCCVRFGNVLGSRASVVTLFQKQIREGKAITITHPHMRRYFMTIPEAVRLVMLAGTLGNEGEVFVLDMGAPVRIVDLARNLIQLHGLQPEKDVPIRFTGLRPGEKFDEELLLGSEEGARSTKCPKILVAKRTPFDAERLERIVNELRSAAQVNDILTLKSLICELNIGYKYALARRWESKPLVSQAQPAISRANS